MIAASWPTYIVAILCYICDAKRGGEGGSRLSVTMTLRVSKFSL